MLKVLLIFRHNYLNFPFKVVIVSIVMMVIMVIDAFWCFFYFQNSIILDGLLDGWMTKKVFLRIAYKNQKLKPVNPVRRYSLKCGMFLLQLQPPKSVNNYLVEFCFYLWNYLWNIRIVTGLGSPPPPK